jgi:predicted RNase H-like HicB family nuclease
MSEPKRPPQEQTPRPEDHGKGDPPIPEELKGVQDLTIRVEAGKAAAYTFSLDFPATLTAIVRSEDEGGYSAEVPALPGCFTEGDTLDELRDNLREAADGWLKAHYGLIAPDPFLEALERIEEP